MDITQGMDVEAVRGIARQLTTEATALEGVRAHVDALTSRASQEWRGQDAQQFNALWRSGARAKLVALIQGLQDLARKAAANADAQEHVSTTLDGVAGGASSGGDGRMVVTPDGRLLPLDDAARLGVQGVTVIAAGGKGFASIREGAETGADWFGQHGDLTLGTQRVKIVAGGLSTLSGFVEISQDPTGINGYLSVASGTLDTVGTISHVPGLNVAAGGIGVLQDGIKSAEAYQDGNAVAGSYYAIHGVASGVGVFVPPVGLVVGALDTGVAIGTVIAESPPMQEFQDKTVTVGTRHCPPEDMGTRYEGPKGFLNFVGDSWEALWTK